jgi:hypothetical protein
MPLFIFLLAWSVAVSSPVIVLLLIGRHRLNRTVGCALLALSFAAATSYKIWQFEWSDVWRHGTPGASLLFIYGCYAAAYGLIGWFLATAILRASHRQSRAQAR